MVSPACTSCSAASRSGRVPALRTEDQWLALARHRLATVYGAQAAEWEVKLTATAPQGARLACAIERKLVESLAEKSVAAQVDLVSVQPFLVAGFNQIEADIMKVGMLGEVTCAAKPFTIIPVVVTAVQDVIAAGQVRGSDQLVDLQQVPQSGTITVYMEPLYAGQFEGIPPGSNCIANAYTSNEERLATEDLGTPTRVFLHAVDAVGMVHAIILRLQALLLPVQTLVLGGH